MGVHRTGHLQSDASFAVLEFHLSEGRSGIKKTLLSGECYDALRQKAYAGSLGHPRSRLKMRRAEFKQTKQTKEMIMGGY